MSEHQEERLPAVKPGLSDPIVDEPAYSDTESRIALASHPVHAMLVAFPISAALGTLGSDVLYWWTGDPFWVRAGLWASGAGFFIGVLAGLVGTVELLATPGIRIRAASWTHFVIAMALLSILGANWGLRVTAGAQALLPWGLLLSALSAAMTALTGWHGGKLVFDYQLGTSRDKGSGRS